jgi:hypothetical protein
MVLPASPLPLLFPYKPGTRLYCRGNAQAIYTEHVTNWLSPPPYTVAGMLNNRLQKASYGLIFNVPCKGVGKSVTKRFIINHLQMPRTRKARSGT